MFLLKELFQGERMTWPVVSKIRRRCIAEFMLDDCIKALRNREREIEGILSDAYRNGNSKCQFELLNGDY